MPRKSKGARLWLREQRGREPVWIIRDGGRQVSTGCAENNYGGAEEALSRYLAQKWASSSNAPRGAADVTVGEILALYGQEHAPNVASPETIGYSIDGLSPFWADLLVSDIRAETCRRYAKQRERKPATIRRELGVLQAAINFAIREGALTETRLVTFPEKPPPKNRWLTRPEAALLLQAARQTPHLARFIVLGLATGTRKEALLSLQWVPSMTGGHIDLEAGVMYRQSAVARRTKKRQPPARLSRKLRSQLTRWRASSRSHVIEWRGSPVQDIKKAWGQAIERSGIEHATPHDLRRTSITWAMQRGVKLFDAAGFYGVTAAELERTYAVHHPDFQRSVVDL
ncbi:MAG: site-specific integrase [Pseudomonadota bacterium]